MSTPARSHAIRYTKTGGTEVIELAEIDTVSPKANELLIKVEWAGVNMIDTYFRKGVYPASFPFTVGQEAAGTIVALPTSPEVLSSEDYKSRGFQIGSKVVGYSSGSMVNFWAVPWNNAAVLPPSVDTRVGAASFVSGLTALTFMRESYAVKKGDWILVHTCAGSLGLQLTQLAALFGARVIGTTSSPEKAAIAKANGAEHVILYKTESVVDRVAEITNGEGVVAVYDGVGKDTWEDNFKLVARKGTIISIGNSSGVVPPFAPMKLTPKNLTVLRPTLGNYLTTPAEFTHYTNEYFSFLDEGKINAIIHGEYGFSKEGVVKAQTELAGGRTVGKLLVKVD